MAVTKAYQAEFIFPFIADANGEDADLSNMARYNILIFENVNLTDPANPSGNGAYAYGAGNEISDLTPPGVDDNDPDYLPDGRIIFKTDRFSVWPQVRIAVMNADGSGIEQLTFVGGASDHDPVGDWTYVVFERFLKETNFATDVESGFTPWDLIEARIDGS